MAWGQPTGTFDDALNAPLGTPKNTEPKRLGYVKIDGVVDVSYSKLNTLYACPRKFHLAEMQGARSFNPKPATAFGHSFGAGVQEYLRAFELYDHEQAKQRAICAALAAWDCYLLTDEDKYKKSTYWKAIDAVERWCETSATRITDQYKLATINGKPGIELFFYVRIGSEYAYQGHIDIVLEDRFTGELVVLEVKTGANAAQRADWANSSQTIGYHCVMQAMGAYAVRPTSYAVLYLYYSKSDSDFTYMPFSRPLAERSEWLSSLLLDVTAIKNYTSSNFWPKRGGACRDWNRDCEFFGMCDMTSYTPPPEIGSYEPMRLEDADFVCDVQDLLALQQEELNTDGATLEQMAL